MTKPSSVEEIVRALHEPCGTCIPGWNNECARKAHFRRAVTAGIELAAEVAYREERSLGEFEHVTIAIRSLLKPEPKP